jgi:hypothetical protein
VDFVIALLKLFSPTLGPAIAKLAEWCAAFPGACHFGG